MCSRSAHGENNPHRRFADGLLVSSLSSALHKWAFLATDEISNTEPVAPVLVDRTAQSVRGRARENYAAYFRDGTLVLRHGTMVREVGWSCLRRSGDGGEVRGEVWASAQRWPAALPALSVVRLA